MLLQLSDDQKNLFLWEQSAVVETTALLENSGTIAEWGEKQQSDVQETSLDGNHLNIP